MIRIGVIGYGYWGPNIVRNFDLQSDARVVAICDTNKEVVRNLCESCPGRRIVHDHAEIVAAPDIDLVAIVTPVSAHFNLAREALRNGKHVFVEKPFTATSEQAYELIELAQQKNLIIMVDHTFIFTGTVRKMKDIINSGLMGRVYYYDSTRINLGKFQNDVNVIWDLAPHDFSIMTYLIDEKPEALSASGMSHVNNHEDVAYISVRFASQLIAHFNVNWLAPVKVRSTIIGGERRMLYWNDIVADEKLKVYDKGVDIGTREGVYQLLVSYRAGDMWVPRVDQTEALRNECAYCIECIEEGKSPINDGHNGLEVVKMLEACGRSLANGGSTVPL